MSRRRSRLTASPRWSVDDRVRDTSRFRALLWTVLGATNMIVARTVGG